MKKWQDALHLAVYAKVGFGRVGPGPYGQKTHLQRPAHLRCLSMVIAQEPAQPLAALNRPLATDVRTPRKQQNVALSPVIALGMVMLDIFAHGPPQRPLAK
jgi:hypothetical protein